MKRIAILLGFLLSLCVFGWHVFCDNELLYCAWVSLAVMFGSTSILLFAMKWIGRILIDHLEEERKLLEEAEKSETPEGQQPAQE